jgi:hypothetical protein
MRPANRQQGLIAQRLLGASTLDGTLILVGLKFPSVPRKKIRSLGIGAIVAPVSAAKEEVGILRLVLLVGAMALALSGCASAPERKPSSPGTLPFDAGNGVGSQFGNYEMRPAGEAHDAAGNRCVIFNWDRPLNRSFAIRYTSESCESKEHPEWMSATRYVRSVIPLSQSNLGSVP